ncbi:MAG: bifunctional diaminohydroxyphosphoribosylaminopyrimidine deaminase/5-amino-6-(5-phosphoribosylamino)uracil reductase RibD [Allorhizobium sp.]
MASPSDDRRFMAEAIALSLTHLGRTSTNPSVGCLIVKDGVVVGRGVTAEGGRPHAETEALADAGENARGATVYVTLEPCSHHGRTPPCANALVAAGIARIVVCVIDPDPRVSGRGLAILRDAGITVETGLLEEEGERALAFYLTRQTKKRPYVILKLAVSADGMIGRAGDGQVSITGPLAREAVQRLRCETDAILIGIGTALADDPQLTVRLAGLEHRSPVRIVLDRHLRLPLTSKLVKTIATAPLIVAGGEGDSRLGDEQSAVAEAREKLRAAGAEVLQDGNLETLLFALVTRGLSSLVVEGGAAVARAFLQAGLVDRILLFQGTSVIGAGGIPSPLAAATTPDGFHPVRTAMYGADRLDEYDRIDELGE